MNRHYLSTFFDLNATSGDLIYKRRDRVWFNSNSEWKRWNSRFAGKVAGYKKKKRAGYRCVQISMFSEDFSAHRIAAVLSGILSDYFDPMEIDHINKNPEDNRPANLRAVLRVENARNLPVSRNNKSGVPGVYFSIKRRRWISEVHIGSGCRKYLGSSPDFFEAVCLRKSEESRLGYFPSHGRNDKKPPPQEGSGDE